ncbi:YceI family protein [Acidicapsa acidisoli]|uniref:YceI family protein n=1 Tax=Acidicapsa acidisoli TaxID=1615681 RepID=UPI0021DF53FF|nr:YceI family protein [Acidicapsa acidisoli]
MKSFARSLLFVLPLAFAPVAFAQHQTLAIAADASQVTFTLGGSDHAVKGTFHVQSGSIDFDSGTQKISGSVVVAAGSGNSGNDGRDKKMKNDVLDVSHFAEVSFVPQSYQGAIAPSGDSTIQITGTFTLHGTPHDLTVPVQVHIDGTNCTAKTHFVVPYVKWGLKDPSVFILKVAKEVDIDLALVGHLSSAN